MPGPLEAGSAQMWGGGKQALSPSPVISFLLALVKALSPCHCRSLKLSPSSKT